MKPALEREGCTERSPERAFKGQREVYFEEFNKFVPTAVYDFDRLTAGAEIPGVAVIETPVTTILINPKDRAVVDALRNVVVHVGEEE